MRLFQTRLLASDGARLGGSDRIVLVVAANRREAAQALGTALGEAMRPNGPASLDDLGVHAGPEEAGSVFVDGYRIAC